MVGFGKQEISNLGCEKYCCKVNIEHGWNLYIINIYKVRKRQSFQMVYFGNVQNKIVSSDGPFKDAHQKKIELSMHIMTKYYG
jgi:hypothetical protein